MAAQHKPHQLIDDRTTILRKMSELLEGQTIANEEKNSNITKTTRLLRRKSDIFGG